MLVFFQICFGVGLAMTVINTVLSLVFGIIGAGHDFDFDIDLDIDFDIGCFLPLTPSLIFLFLTVFGGTGMIAYDSLPVPVTIAVAFAIAVAVNFVMWKFIVKPLKKISAKEVADENSYIFLDIYKYIKDDFKDASYFNSDQLHPNDEGHELIANAFMNYFNDGTIKKYSYQIDRKEADNKNYN